MIMGVGRPIIPLSGDFQARGNCLFLNYEREMVTNLILIETSIPMISLHLFQVLDDLVEVEVSTDNLV